MPPPGRARAEAFVTTHLAHLVDRRVAATQPLSSARYRGGQRAADLALDRFRVEGYARGAEVAYPQRARTGSGLSPWIRNGLLDPARLWDHVADGPADDVAAFRQALLRLERARLRYAATAPLRSTVQVAAASRPRPAGPPAPGWDRRMGCVDLALDELADDGWLPAPPRAWLAQLSDSAATDDELYRHLLDGSRAVSRPAWAAAANAMASAAPMSRWRVERQAPGLCASCELVAACPIDHEAPDLLVPASFPGPASSPVATDDDLRLPALGRESLGPEQPLVDPTRAPEAVWITAESMGDADPALVAHPELPALFVLDEPLLARLRLAPRRLVFLVEHLSDLATRRPVELWLGSPVSALADRTVSVTFTPVPGWHRRAVRIAPAVVHPWPWLGRHLARPGIVHQTANAIGVTKTGGSQFPHGDPIDQGRGSATQSSTGRNIGALV